MPHCIIEHSADLLDICSAEKLMNAVFIGASQSMLFDDHDIKIRALSFDHYQTSNTTNAFVHIIIKVLDGRTIEQKAGLSSLILSSVQKLDLKNTSLTVEIVEIESASYGKIIS